MNPSRRITVDPDIPINVFNEDGGVRVSTGSYGAYPGLSLRLDFEYLGEVNDENIRQELHALLEAAFLNAEHRTDIPVTSAFSEGLDKTPENAVALAEPTPEQYDEARERLERKQNEYE